MRHIYVGDVGDFGKYGLLRALCDDSVTLGVVWYLTDATEHNNDGKHDGYLKLGSEAKRAQFRDCDSVLYDRLKEIRGKERLDVSLIEKGAIFESTCSFYGAPVPYFAGRVDTKQAAIDRWTDRKRWHDGALLAVEKATVVFVDPDNGIIFDKPSNGTRPSHKHAYLHELKDYIDRGQTLVAYHHLGRQKGGHELLIQSCLRRLRESGLDAFAVHYTRGTGRVFFVFSQPAFRSRTIDALAQFAQAWKQHAKLINGCA